MMKRTRFFTAPSWAVILLLLLSSCNKENASTESGATGGNGNAVPIGFSSSVASLADTRAGAITDIRYMYVFASYTGTSDWTAASIPNFMYRQLMEKSPDGTWTYASTKYWPGNTNEKISFFAYAPMDVEGLSLSPGDVAGPKLTYIVPTQESEKQDLLLGSVMNRTSAGGQVSFLMKHALAQIRFRVKSGDANATKVLKGLTVHAPGKGIVSFAADGSLEWPSNTIGTPATFTADDTFRGGTTVGVPGDTSQATDIIGTFFLLPIGDPSAAGATISLDFTLQKTSDPVPVELTATSLFPASQEWTAGSTVTYTLTLVDDRLEFGTISVEGFGGGTSSGSDIPAT